MKYTQAIKACSLSLTLGFMMQIGHAAAIKATHIPLSPERASLIGKALQQQKQGESTLRGENDLKVLTEIKLAPTQSFFASQNQQFTRFIQALFPINNS